MIGPREMVDSIVDFRVWVSGAFSTKFEYGPIFAMFIVEEFDQLVGGVSICFLRIGRGWAGRCNNCPRVLAALSEIG